MLTFPSYPSSAMPQASASGADAAEATGRQSRSTLVAPGPAVFLAVMATLAAFATTVVFATSNSGPATVPRPAAAPMPTTPAAKPAPADKAAPVTKAGPTAQPAAPVALPPSPHPTDGRGFVNTKARCEGASALAALARTERSLIVICRLPDGRHEYGGVRIGDGAALRVAKVTATPAGFVADNDGATYDVSARGLVVKRDDKVLVSEPMLEYRATP